MPDYFHKALVESFRRRDVGGRRHDVVYASDAGVELQIGEEKQIHGTCLRKQYYRITGTPVSDPDDPRSNFVTGVGDAVHDKIADVFRSAEQLVSTEVPIWIEEIKLSGRMDLIIRPEKKRIGVEIKSVGGYHNTVGVIHQNRKVSFAPKIYHLCQTVVYAQHMFDQSNGEMDEWVILYIDRESGDFAEHNIRYVSPTELWVNNEPSSITPDRVYARWNTLWKYIADKALPPRDYEIQYSKEKMIYLAEAGRLNKKDTQGVKAGKLVDKGDQQCRAWCNWRTRCWTEDIGK